MRICTFGLWHLGSVLSAHLAKLGFDVTGVDPDARVVENLNSGRAPLFEPGLDDLLQKGLAEEKLRFTVSLKQALREADAVWVTFDTPVLKNDEVDLNFLKKQFDALIKNISRPTLALVSSQVPVGFCASIEKLSKEKNPAAPLKLCYAPENLRLGKALSLLDQPDRIIAGTRESRDRALFEPILSKLASKIIWMKTESAEMTKHGINAFLAMSVSFSNELAAICESVGADAGEVAAGMLSESRIGPSAYLKPGAGYAGGTLGRDIQFLNKLSARFKKFTPVINAVNKSNDHHRDWAKRKILSELSPLKNKSVAVLGLAYKAGTDTLRQSWTMELIEWLLEKKARVKAFDPAVKKLPPAMGKMVALCDSIDDALDRSDCLVIGNEDPAFKTIGPSNVGRMSKKIILDPHRSLWTNLQNGTMKLDYHCVGYSSRAAQNGSHGR